MSIAPSVHPPRRPMVRARRATLVEREVRERLSASAVEILLDAAEVLSEGRFADENPLYAGSPAGRAAFFGSTMLTVDVARLRDRLADACDERTARRLASLLGGDARMFRRARQVAESEAERIAGRRLRVSASEVRVRARGTQLFVDVDLEADPVPSLRLVRTVGR